MSHLRSQITQSHLPILNYTQQRDPLAVEVTSSQGLGTWGWGHCEGGEGTALLAPGGRKPKQLGRLGNAGTSPAWSRTAGSTCWSGGLVERRASQGL